MTRQRAGRMAAGLLLALVAVAVPAAAAAHPLGNFTINHYAGLRIGASAVAIDVVIDHAEIPAFGERQRIDLDRDGAVSAAEQETERAAACGQLAGDLALIVANQSQTLVPVAAGLSFPAGAGGLPTMRLVCQYEVALASPITTATEVSFTDRSFSERVGWREIAVVGDGLVVPAGVPAASVSERLTAYPESVLATPPDVRSITLSVAPGGAPAAPFTAPDAQPLVAEATPGAGDGASEVSAVPGGVGSEISALLRTQDLTPLVLLASLLAAALLGAGHALTPGHGKTIMAAYLVGSQGSARHAVGLGLATAVSHTIGVVALGALILAAGSALPAERIYPVLGLASALLVVAIGAWMVAAQWRVVAAAVRRTPAFAGEGAHHHAPHDQAHAHDHPHAHDHGSGHPHPHPHAHAAPGEVGWRSLFTLGLAGGLVPSTNALLILVATVATGRPAFGLVLVAAFGIGMAAVLVGLGIALVVAGDRLAGVGNRPWLTTVLGAAPVLGAFAVLTLGIFLTVAAVGGAAVL